MKKVVKSSLLIAFIAVMLISLTGCGKDDSNNSKSEDQNKIVATKTTTDNLLGTTYDEDIEITFKDGKFDQAVFNYECESEQEAQGMYYLYMTEASGYKDMDVKQDGKKVVVTSGAKSFASLLELDEDDISKDAINKVLKEEGYTIK